MAVGPNLQRAVSLVESSLPMRKYKKRKKIVRNVSSWMRHILASYGNVRKGNVAYLTIPATPSLKLQNVEKYVTRIQASKRISVFQDVDGSHRKGNYFIVLKSDWTEDHFQEMQEWLQTDMTQDDPTEPRILQHYIAIKLKTKHPENIQLLVKTLQTPKI